MPTSVVAYLRRRGLAPDTDEAEVEGLGWECRVSCFSLARVDAKSPAEFLTEPERTSAGALARHLLLDPPRDPLDARCW
jgi:hypothetical protein